MSVTLLSDVSDQVQTFWSPMLVPELKEKTLLPALVNRDYEGDIKPGGSTVRVSQIVTPTGTRKTVGSNHDTFNAQKLTTRKVDLVADQVITAAFEFDDLVQLQSQIGDADSEIRAGLLKALEIEVNKYLYSLVAPSTSSPDHSIASVTDFNAAELLKARKLLSQAQVPDDGNRWLLCDPSYMNDLLTAQTLTSGDYVDDAPVVGGKMARQRFGFNILEDTSSAMFDITGVTATEDCALWFHPDFLLFVMGAPSIKVSDLHAQKRHGFLISASIICGAKLGLQGNVKHGITYAT